MRCCLLVLIAFFLGSAVRAQEYKIDSGDTIFFPADEDYLFDRRKRDLWLRIDSEWTAIPIPNAYGAHSWRDGYLVKQGDMKTFVLANGKKVFEKAHYVHPYGENYLAFICGTGTYLTDPRGDTLAFVPGAASERSARIPSTIRGTSALCLAQYRKVLHGVRASNLRNYGMIDKAGNWLIQPRYDAPFAFKDGIAKVIWKGKEIWINENEQEVPPPQRPEPAASQTE